MSDTDGNPDAAADEPSANEASETAAQSSQGTRARQGRMSLVGRALYPRIYVWYVFLASLDLMFTYLIIHPDVFVKGFNPDDPSDELGLTPRGAEVNPLADWILQRWGLPGMVLFKLGIVLIVIGICEIVGRHKDQTGRALAKWAVALSAIPVVVALWFLVRELMTPH